MSTRGRPLLVRLLLVGAGYAVALVAAVLAVRLRDLGVDPQAVDASSGMWAFVDVVLFCTVAGILSIPPTWLLLRILRPFRGWESGSWVLFLWSLTTPLRILTLVLMGGRGPATANVPLVMRNTVAPAFLGLALLGRVNAPTPGSKRRLGWAALCEATGTAVMMLPALGLLRALLEGALR